MRPGAVWLASPMSRRSRPEGELEGEYDERFAAVGHALAGYLDEGDTGGSVAVYVDGEPVVDGWGGYADAGRTVAWEEHTITNVWSTTKTMIALCALILADRGDLDGHHVQAAAHGLTELNPAGAGVDYQSFLGSRYVVNLR